MQNKQPSLEGAPIGKLKALTPTQLIILRMMTEEGLSQKQISIRLQKSRTSIKRHYNHMRARLGLTSIHQVIAFAVSRGWIKAPAIDIDQFQADQRAQI